MVQDAQCLTCQMCHDNSLEMHTSSCVNPGRLCPCRRMRRSHCGAWTCPRSSTASPQTWPQRGPSPCCLRALLLGAQLETLSAIPPASALGLHHPGSCDLGNVRQFCYADTCALVAAAEMFVQRNT